MAGVIIQRPPPRNAFEWAERGWRIALAWMLILFIVAPLALFITVVLAAIAAGLIKAVMTGQPMPDITGGLDRILAQIMPYVGPAILSGLTALGGLLLSRHREVDRQIQGGSPGGAIPLAPSSPPPLPSEPSATGGLVNNEAIR